MTPVEIANAMITIDMVRGLRGAVVVKIGPHSGDVAFDPLIGQTPTVAEKLRAALTEAARRGAESVSGPSIEAYAKPSDLNAKRLARIEERQCAIARLLLSARFAEGTDFMTNPRTRADIAILKAMLEDAP